MYSYVGSVVLQNVVDAQYSTPDVSQTPINVLYANYSEIFLVLSNPYLTSNIFVNFMQYKPQLNGYNGTITQWLANIGNLTLSTVPALPTSSVSYARWSDATKAGYKMNLCKVGFQIPLNYPTDMLPDLQITRPEYNTNLGLIHNNCLVTINGYLHQTDYDGTYAYAIQGASTMRKSKVNNMGILSFLDIGTIVKLPIDTTAVFADSTDTTQSLKNKIYMYLNQDLTNKTVLLSLGGYLVFPEPGIFYQVDKNIFALHTDALPIPQRFFESSKYIDLSSLGLDATNIYPDTINLTQLLSDTVLKNYLALSQSFWIIVDTPSLSYSKQYIESAKLPGRFIAYEKPINPLFVGYGRMAEYWNTYEDGQYSVTVDNSFIKNYTFASDVFDGLENINTACIPSKPVTYSRGYTLQIHN